MKIHIVDSVKGGSGKSTFSLKLCCALKNEDNVKPCVIDLDLLGTSWFYLFSNLLVNVPKNKYEKIIFLNDIVKDFEYYKNMRFIQSIKIVCSLPSDSSGKIKKDLEIDAILCNPASEAKRDYIVDENRNATDISYDIFCDEVLALLEYLNDQDYTDVILDMPPNVEPYSNKIMQACLDVNSQIKCVEKVNLYKVSSINMAHVNSTLEWYYDFVFNTPSFRLATFNNSHKINKDKDEWFKSERFKFFTVFNEISPPPSYELQNLILQEYREIAKMLAFYHITFDDLFSDSMYGLFGIHVSTVVPGTVVVNSFDISSYKLFHELSK